MWRLFGLLLLVTWLMGLATGYVLGGWIHAFAALALVLLFTPGLHRPRERHIS
jgi:hypothetical protein